MLANTFSLDSIPINTSFLLTASFALLPLLIWGLVSLFDDSAKYPGGVTKYSILDDKNATDKSHAAGSFPTLAAALSNAFPKFKEAAYVISGKRSLVWSKNFVIIPPKFVDSLKSLPEDKLSFIQSIQDRFNSKLTYTTMKNPANMDVFIKSISVDLTRHIAKIMGDLDEELTYAFENLLPPCDDWTEVYPGQIIPQVVALASGRIFVGLPLSRNPEFVKSTITFTVDSFLAGEELNKYPKILRPYIAPWVKLVKVCEQQHITMRRLLKPQLEERFTLIKEGKELPADMMTWIINNSSEKYKFDLEHQASCQMSASLAAIHTTTMTASHAWLDMAARPEYLEPLREEWDEVIDTEPTGVISKTSMPKLRKLDSFVKESQRISPISSTSFERKVTGPVTLPDGTKLEKGSYLAVATEAIGADGSLWEHPEKFDGFRFEKLRQQAGNESRYQFATTGVESMYFGHGKHACPGRFFAANEIKLILAYLLRNYDMKLPEGQERPSNIVTPSGNVPDYSKPLLLKKRIV